MATPSAVKRTPDPSGDDIATLVVGGRHTQVVAPAALATRYDAVSSALAYVGMAEAGSLPASAVWRIARITTSGAGGVTVEYADGDTAFDNVWNNRTGLTYS